MPVSGQLTISGQRLTLETNQLIGPSWEEGSTIKTATKRINNVVSALSARAQLGQIIKRATQENERFVVGHRGEPALVIMSVKDYIDTIAPTPKELRAMQAAARRTGAARLGQRAINSIISEVRRGQRGSVKRKAS